MLVTDVAALAAVVAVPAAVAKVILSAPTPEAVVGEPTLVAEEGKGIKGECPSDIG
jgi:hypothetical protein